MRAKVPMIHWHAKQAVLSIDFSPSDPSVFATGGGDKQMNIWKLASDERDLPTANHQCSLACAHAVNVLRFSPLGDMVATGGVSGEITLWRPVDASAQRVPILGQDEEEKAPLWKAASALRGHAGDVQDLAWSPDGAALVSGGVEGVIVLWDVEQRRAMVRLESHQHYVQGVCWDPMGWSLLSTSNDRTAKVYTCKPAAGKKQQALASGAPVSSAATLKDFHCAATLSRRTISAPDNNDAAGISAPASAAADAGTAVGMPPQSMPAPPAKHPLFQDENTGSMFRRPVWSPDGSMVVLPSGLFKSDSSCPAIPTTYIFSRGDWTAPVAHLPGLCGTASVAARFSPVLYRLRPVQAEGDASHPCFASLPYRMVWAVATRHSIMVYDTQSCHQHPVVLLGGVHLAPVTDLAWSCDGRCLAVSSTDGYCSLLVFEEGELGEVMPEDELPAQVVACTMHTHAKKVLERSSAKQASVLASAPAVLQQQPPATTPSASRAAGRPGSPTDPDGNDQGRTSAQKVTGEVVDLTGSSSMAASRQGTAGSTTSQAAAAAGMSPALQQAGASVVGGRRRICPTPSGPAGQAAAIGPAAKAAVDLASTAQAAAPGTVPPQPPTAAVQEQAAAGAAQGAGQAAAAAAPKGRRITPMPVKLLSSPAAMPAATGNQASAAAAPGCVQPAVGKPTGDAASTLHNTDNNAATKQTNTTQAAAAATPALVAAPAAAAVERRASAPAKAGAGQSSLAMLAAQAGKRMAHAKRVADANQQGDAEDGAAAKRHCT